MNCANHPDAEKVAFCRTCGKPLCANCTRDVRGVVYCESCLAARLEGVQPQQTVYQQVMDQGAGLKVPPAPGSGPNPTVAGILAGFFPVGVGAVYNTQYAKGLAHLLIFTGLVWGLSSGSDSIAPVLGLSLGFFYFYQIIDAVRSARAIQMGQPAPDPFGLGRTFSAGEKVDAAKIPTGAIILIGLGVLFMLHNLGFWFFNLDHFWPVILIAIGVWLFVRRWGASSAPSACGCDRCRARTFMGPAVLVTLGTLFLLEQTDVISFHRTWPVLLVVIGLVKVFQGNASISGHIDVPLPPGPGGPTGTTTGEVQPPSSEVHHG
ncbi:MAG: DUF5668 domain-containing protein [Acidobacteriia bacterium]|nr:DUF5668 domain-containing protein [Terriglobia bacterium]